MKRQRSRRRPRQTELDLRTWGGRRRGAGRKPYSEKAGVSHSPRPDLASRFPVHVTLRVRRHVWNLRTRRCFRVIARAFAGVREHQGFRLVHYCVQGNHLHLLVEARDKKRLARVMQGLSVRLARGLNRLMQRRGAVFADRYHSHILQSPSEVRRALAYLLLNSRRHAAQGGRPVGPPGIDPYSSGACFDGWAGEGARAVARASAASGAPPGTTKPAPSRRPTDVQLPAPLSEIRSLVRPAGTWLLSRGWRRIGLIRPDEIPGVRRRSRAGVGSGTAVAG